MSTATTLPPAVARLVYSSVEDVKSSMPHHTATDIPVLVETLQVLIATNAKTKALLVRRRIKKLRKTEVVL